MNCGGCGCRTNPIDAVYCHACGESLRRLQLRKRFLTKGVASILITAIVVALLVHGLSEMGPRVLLSPDAPIMLAEIQRHRNEPIQIGVRLRHMVDHWDVQLERADHQGLIHYEEFVTSGSVRLLVRDEQVLCFAGPPDRLGVGELSLVGDVSAST